MDTAGACDAENSAALSLGVDVLDAPSGAYAFVGPAIGELGTIDPLDDTDVILLLLTGGGGSGDDKEAVVDDTFPESGGRETPLIGAAVGAVAIFTGATDPALAREGFSFTGSGKSFQPSFAFLFR